MRCKCYDVLRPPTLYDGRKIPEPKFPTQHVRGVIFTELAMPFHEDLARESAPKRRILWKILLLEPHERKGQRVRAYFGGGGD